MSGPGPRPLGSASPSSKTEAADLSKAAGRSAAFHPRRGTRLTFPCRTASLDSSSLPRRGPRSTGSKLFHLISSRYNDECLIGDLHREFNEAGYVKLPGLLRASAFDHLCKRMQRLRERAIRRAFNMPGVGTPRRLATLGGSSIAREDPLLASLYFHHEVIGLVRGVVGEALFACEHTQEFMVANFLTQPGDSHGWHLDDPAYAIVIVFEAPSPEQGGTVELIPRWRDRCRMFGDSADTNVTAGVNRARSHGAIQERHHLPGDAYVLHASTVLHRVTPVAAPESQRSVLNMAYQRQEHQQYGHTATALYSDPSLDRSTAFDWVPESAV